MLDRQSSLLAKRRYGAGVVLALLLAAGLASGCRPAPPKGPTLTRADFAERSVTVPTVYTYSRYTRLFIIEDGKRREVQCSCLDNCSHGSFSKWKTPRLATVTLLESPLAPDSRPLLRSISEPSTGATVNYSYDRCLK